MPLTCDDVLLSCEHGGNHVPAAYRDLFAGPRARAALRSHLGWDPGARAVALAFKRRTGAPLHEARTTRLLVELNRSLHHRRLFSPFSVTLSPEQRARVLSRYYHPYRDGVEYAISRHVACGRAVLHLSVHSFVGAWQGQAREVDVGLLYDPARPGERRLCLEWKASLSRLAPALRVRRNYPYRGVSDGLVTHLRRRFGPRRYIGIELEMNQALVAAPGTARRQTVEAVIESFRGVLAQR